MSTRSHIGIKIGDKVKYVYCHSDGYLSYVGLYLHLFYKSPEKVKKLIALGDLSCIGYNIDAPKQNIEFFELSKYHSFYMSQHVKTTFCISYARDRNEKDCGPNVVDFNTYCSYEGVSYSYYFDMNTKKWYMVFNIPRRGGRKEVKPYAIEDIVANREAFSAFKKETGYYESYKEIKECMNDLLADMTLKGDRTIISQYNRWLHEDKKFKTLEFGYVVRSGVRVYALFFARQSSDAPKKRIVCTYSPCIGDLVKYLHDYYNVDFY